MARRLIAAGLIHSAGGKTTTITRTENGAGGRILPAARKEQQK
ncbi:hypothetical protein [Streptomyces sp. NPDC101115]